MADTEEQRKLAVSHVGGSSSKLCMLWRSSLTSTVAKLEAYIDFSEDENIEEGVLQEVEQGETLILLSLLICTCLED
eukprot:m.33432 g.33432  ORF g.33432 m.33432 type:complete len:77 (+) comp6449_c0_seq1:740-970(+)